MNVHTAYDELLVRAAAGDSTAVADLSRITPPPGARGWSHTAADDLADILELKRSGENGGARRLAAERGEEYRDAFGNDGPPAITQTEVTPTDPRDLAALIRREF